MNQLIDRRHFLKLLTALAAAPVGTFAQGASATARLVVGYPPGGTADALARVLAPMLGKSAGMTVIVDNRPGASGQIAAENVRQAPPDGLSLLLTPSTVLSLTPQLYRKPMYNPLHDFTPVGCVCDHSFAFAVPGTSPVKSVAEFVTAAKAQASDVSFASPGAGSSPHFLCVMFGRATGVNMLQVPYKGVAPGLQDLAGGQIAATMNPLPTMLELHRAGRIRILAVTNPKRVGTMPDVPTFAELKLPSLTYTEWYGFFASRHTPAAAVQRWDDMVREAVTSPRMAQAAEQLALQPLAANASALRTMLETDHRRWTDIVKSTGIQLES